VIETLRCEARILGSTSWYPLSAIKNGRCNGHHRCRYDLRRGRWLGFVQLVSAKKQTSRQDVPSLRGGTSQRERSKCRFECSAVFGQRVPAVAQNLKSETTGDYKSVR
jgi:hypothetical protein